MALKFQCNNCGKDIAVRFLKVGEAAECRKCRANNSVPDSAEDISDAAAERMIKASVPESAEAISDESAQSVPIAKALHRVAKIVIGIGIIVGMVPAIGVMIRHPAPDQTMAVALSGGTTWLMNMFFFCILGVLCLGIAKILNLLNK